jgi:hypothetical protein
MKSASRISAPAALALVGALTAGGPLSAPAEMQPGEIVVRSVDGLAAYSADGSNWAVLQPHLVLGGGIVLKTEADATVDLVMRYSGTALRLTPGTVLEVATLTVEDTRADLVTETRLNLKSGALLGSQRKLAKASKFEVATPEGIAAIRGTDYLIQADGAVNCFSGEVALHYRAEGASVADLQVPAGSRFEPASRQVVTAAPADAAKVAADFRAVREIVASSQPAKPNCIVEPECKISPCEPPGHGGHGGHDGHGGNDGHDGHGGNDGHDGHGGNDGNNDHGGKGNGPGGR